MSRKPGGRAGQTILTLTIAGVVCIIGALIVGGVFHSPAFIPLIIAGPVLILASSVLGVLYLRRLSRKLKQDTARAQQRLAAAGGWSASERAGQHDQ